MVMAVESQASRPGAEQARRAGESTRRKIDEIVQSVIAAAPERTFETIAAREIKRLQQKSPRRRPLTIA
jgi:hypothetical protein